MNVEYIDTDEITDFLSSLHWTLKTLNEVDEDPTNWKWVVICLHSALQGALVCHLSGTAGLGAFEKGKKFDALVHWLHNDNGYRAETPRPREPFIANVPELTKRLQSRNNQLERAGKEIPLDKKEKDAIRRLCDLRDEFTHFGSKSWCIQTAGLPIIVRSTMGVIARIADEGCFFLQANVDQRIKIKNLIDELQK